MALTSKPNARRAVIIFGGLTLLGILLIALFYAEENWRGRRAWEKCKRELEAKGEVLDWTAYIPPPVPDDQNIFKAPKMADWFVRPRPGSNRTNELSTRLNSDRFVHAGPNSNSVTLAKLTVLPPATNAGTAAEKADIVLRYSSYGTAAFLNDPSSVSTNDPGIPIIAMEKVPLSLVIDHLARNANLKYSLDAKIGSGPAGSDAELTSEPVVSAGWTNITARQALLAALNKYDLQLIDDPATGVAHITAKKPDAFSTYLAPDVRRQVVKLFQVAAGPNAIGSQGMILFAKSSDRINPMRMVFHSEKMPANKEMTGFFTELFPNDFATPDSFRLWVEPAGTNSFRVTLDAVSAADYLAWSDSFESDFDLIREALKRPYARIDGNYEYPFAMPIPDFVAFRALAQTLAQRAQCHLLLGRPEQALHELTLLHDMGRLLESSPTGKPMTMVTVLINVAVAGVYADAIADGMRLQTWREPQLIALQKQLGEINLGPFLSEAFNEERARACFTIENLEDLLSPKPNLWRKIKNGLSPTVPRGWLYQNLVTIAALDQDAIDSCDSAHGVIRPHKMNDFQRQLEAINRHYGPYTFFAAITVVNYTKALQTFAFIQTKANEASIVCALERYRLVHGEYPEALDALVPQYIEKLPHDIIGGQPLDYRRTANGKFLLYSVGWNETDDGGQVAFTKSGSVDREKGDWVWKNPTP